MKPLGHLLPATRLLDVRHQARCHEGGQQLHARDRVRPLDRDLCFAQHQVAVDGPVLVVRDQVDCCTDGALGGVAETVQLPALDLAPPVDAPGELDAAEVRELVDPVCATAPSLTSGSGSSHLAGPGFCWQMSWKPILSKIVNGTICPKRIIEKASS